MKGHAAALGGATAAKNRCRESAAMTHAEDALRAELEERLRFEALLADLSARFVHVPADQVDRLIEEACQGSPMWSHSGSPHVEPTRR